MSTTVTKRYLDQIYLAPEELRCWFLSKKYIYKAFIYDCILILPHFALVNLRLPSYEKFPQHNLRKLLNGENRNNILKLSMHRAIRLYEVIEI